MGAKLSLSLRARMRMKALRLQRSSTLHQNKCCVGTYIKHFYMHIALMAAAHREINACLRRRRGSNANEMTQLRFVL